jgi:hypothetical protein
MVINKQKLADTRSRGRSRLIINNLKGDEGDYNIIALQTICQKDFFTEL